MQNASGPEREGQLPCNVGASDRFIRGGEEHEEGSTGREILIFEYLSHTDPILDYNIEGFPVYE